LGEAFKPINRSFGCEVAGEVPQDGAVENRGTKRVALAEQKLAVRRAETLRRLQGLLNRNVIHILVEQALQVALDGTLAQAAERAPFLVERLH
jgi:hypothetical protein